MITMDMRPSLRSSTRPSRNRRADDLFPTTLTAPPRRRPRFPCYVKRMIVALSERGRRSVLLLDDDVSLLHLHHAKFEQRGYEVHSFLAADEALKSLRAGFTPSALV